MADNIWVFHVSYILTFAVTFKKTNKKQLFTETLLSFTHK